jgi:ATP-dependent Clp protease ATP-binding subunit ClpC
MHHIGHASGASSGRQESAWLNERFLTVKVEPPTEDAAIKVLQIVKNRFEKFHSVEYTDDALTTAVVLSNRLVTNHCLPDKAIDVIDDAGAYVKMTQEKTALPEELVEARKRLAFVARRHENAVENHEFEKARFYADEEGIQREALKQLHLKHNIPEAQIVGREHIEEVLMRWTGLSIKAVREASGNPETETQKLKTSPKKSKKRKSS